MNLTAGATLQNHKYVIQKLLRQSDLGITYEAQHAYLGQAVALQTFNETVRQRNDFAQLRQQFFDRVRSSVQQPNAQSIRVLDCFDEDGIPFVVLEIVPGQPLPLLTDWLPILDEPIAPTQLSASALDTSIPSKPEQQLNDSLLVSTPGTAAPEDRDIEDTEIAKTAIGASYEETQPPSLGFHTLKHTIPANNLSASNLSGQSPSGRNTYPSQLPSRPTGTVPTPTPTAMGTQVVVPRPAPVRPHSKAWMPVSLIFLSMMGGIVGAGYGLSLRLTSAPQSEATPNPPNPPRLFSREQSFPSDAEWPISETPQIYPADPTPIEEPVYRVSPAIESYTQPEFVPLPNQTEYQAPVLPSQPAIGTASPQPDAQPAPLPSILTEDNASSGTTPPPEPSAPPIPLAPEPAVEPPSLPALSEPIEPAPAAEPAPPVLPPTDPAIIKQ
jgi:hypothetical protein